MSNNHAKSELILITSHPAKIAERDARIAIYAQRVIEECDIFTGKKINCKSGESRVESTRYL
jgi:hypothetical protein